MLPPTPALFALIAWLPLTVLLFLLVPQRIAILSSYVLGWLFLPQASIRLPGVLPDYDRGLAILSGVLAGILLLDFQRFARLKPHWLDLPLAAMCVAPLLASLTNGLGVRDGLGQMLATTLAWGLPYLIARMYFGDASGLRMLATAVVIGGLIYVPLCLFEARLSPTLHYTVYGFNQHSFAQTRRFGGWRPMVFLAHGLELGMFMAASSLLAFWLWVTGAARRYEGLTMLLVGLLIGTTILCRSTGAILLMFAGCGALWLGGKLGRRLPIVVVALLPITYASVRVAGLWKGEGVVDAARRLAPDRAASLQFRLDNEDLLIEKALTKPLFGWGGWGRYRVYNEDGQDISVTDGMWIIEFGKTGLLGLSGLLLAYLLPVLVFLRLVPPKLWGTPSLAPAAALTCLLTLWMVDNLLNAMYTPIAVLTMGGLVSFLQRLLRLRRRAQAERLARPVTVSEREPAVAVAGPDPGSGGPPPDSDATAGAAP